MPSMLRLREEAKHRPGGLGLGWLLPLAIGGGILLFIALGLLLSWKIKSRNKPCNSRVYAMGDLEMQPRSRSRSRLTKRPGLASEYSGSRLSSTLSFSLPPVLPPLPSYDGILDHQRGRTRERSWIDEDALHGPQVRKSVSESWIFNSPSWFGRTPTLPAFEITGPSQAIATEDAQEDARNDDGHQTIYIPKRDSRASSKQDQSLPMSGMQHGALRNWSRPGLQLQPCPDVTESNLQDILRSTEQRLRTGTSQGFERSITSSSTDTSLGKPSDSGQSLALLGNGQRKNLSAAPNKRASDRRLSPLHRRNSSVFSAGSTTNSLLAEATHELELLGFGGRQTFGRPNVEDDEPQIDLDVQPVQPVHQRSTSGNSRASSSLSTLYSVGDVEEDRLRGLGVDRRAQLQSQAANASTADAKTRLMGPRPLRRQNFSITSLGVSAGMYGMPMPLRPVCLNPQLGNGFGRDIVDKSESFKMAITLQPPNTRPCEEVRPKGQEAPKDIGYRSPSETSRVSESESDTSEAAGPPPKGATQQAWHMYRGHSESPPQSPTSHATRATSADEPSSVNGNDLVSVLMSGTSTKRTLPDPPSDTCERSSAYLSPIAPARPRVKLSSHSRRASICSSVGSDYDGDGWMVGEQDLAGHTKRAPTLRSARGSQAVGSTVAQLRRMNSTMSTYSVASIASTMVADPEPSQTTSGGHAYSHSHSSSKNSGISSRHYFNLGGGGSGGGSSSNVGARGSTGDKLSTKQKQQLAQRRRSRRMSVVLQPTLLEQPDHGKENQAPELQMPFVDASSAAIGASKINGTFSRDPTLVGRASLLRVDELKAETWRSSVRKVEDDLSMYDDGDGFLQPSQENEMKNRCLRM